MPCLLLAGALLAAPAAARPAEAQEPMSQRITLQLNEQEMSTVLARLEQKTGVHFLYSPQLIKANRRVSVKAVDEPLSSILASLLTPLGVRFEQVSSGILLKPVVTAEAAGVPGAAAFPVKGRVVDKATGQGLPGVTVLVKGTTTGASTDAEGNFSLSAPDGNATLVVSYIGYATQEVPVNNAQTVAVTLVTDNKALDEVVVVGYGTLRREDVTGAISSVKAADIRTEGANTLTRSLQGRVAGVQIESGGGAPGSGLRVLVRGAGSFNSTNPLYVVDGVWVGDINYLQPSDIASIDVLKDASAASIYGAQGANGVVLITTKSGKKGPVQFTANAYVGVQKLTKNIEVLNAQEWATVSNAAHVNANLKPLDIAKDPAALGAGTDWQKEIYQTAPTQNYTLGASGGGDNYNFSISGGYFDQKGIVKTTDYNRFNLRIKSDFTKGRLKVGESIIMAQEYWHYTAGGWGGQGGNPTGSALKMIPAFGIYDPTAVGGFSGASGPVVNIANPVAMLNLEVPENRSYNAIINAYAEISILDGLKYKYNLGYTPGFGAYYDYTYPYQVGSLFTNPYATLSENRSQSNTWLHENTLTYAKVFGKHSLNVLGGYTYQNGMYRYLGAAKSNIPLGLNVIDAGNLNPVANSNASESTTISYLGRLVYSFDDRYVFTGTIRRDGSSRFGPSYRYGNFTSVALAWNVANEAFFQPLRAVVSTLKVRGSYGTLGNQNFGNYLYYATIVPNTNYVIGNGQTLWGGATQISLANPNIKWEETRSSNVGIDFGFFNNKLTLTTDYFVRSSKDAIIPVPIAGSNGSIANPVVNAGTISNRGFEAALNYTNTQGGFTYTLLGTATAIRSKVDELSSGSQQIFGGQPTFQGAQATVGQAGIPLGAFYLIKADGIFQTQAEVDAYAKEGKKIQPNAKPGDIRFVDYNNDGQISQSDRQLLGNPTPKLAYGFGGNFAWKGFDLSVYFQGTYGNQIYNGVRQDLEGMNLEQNYGRATLNAWTPTNTNTDVPRAVINDPNGNGQTSSRFLESGSYLRFKTLQFGYTIPASAISALSITSCRVYVSADNLFTTTKYLGYNPDLGRSEGGTNILDRGVDRGYGAYPLSRTLLAGVQVAF
ncbi:TonB-dependent receptor [Hymenobacter arcticus]